MATRRHGRLDGQLCRRRAPDRAGGRLTTDAPSQQSREGPVRSRGSRGFVRSGRESPALILFSRGAGSDGEVGTQMRSPGLWYNIQVGDWK
ncbi:hypothetical protein NDU88_001539 [Pleurodeles waltl]|uniref:Uncharacterized protein n=1 Tax=Pleurodeles waltl TaxID=8319 RepID=A0AAV7U8P7_PLEWA|nr:hypothetical protein NDU88_001539 [Pleurodeles waltl]